MKHLLNSVNLIISKYKEIEKVSGESFNIFSIMGMESDEVRTHSAIINELLNPNGSHGLNEVPLELFFKRSFF
ncbi:PD-(D/E)XK nuclease family protein [Moheibacter sp.]|uniref:PD-(D/E)XK nuclease family protein n=1 Tax=Moheibacter sp. TaxID=1965316 RepID=UPI003C72F5C6